MFQDFKITLFTKYFQMQCLIKFQTLQKKSLFQDMQLSMGDWIVHSCRGACGACLGSTLTHSGKRGGFDCPFDPQWPSLQILSAFRNRSLLNGDFSIVFLSGHKIHFVFNQNEHRILRECKITKQCLLFLSIMSYKTKPKA